MIPDLDPTTLNEPGAADDDGGDDTTYLWHPIGEHYDTFHHS